MALQCPNEETKTATSAHRKLGVHVLHAVSAFFYCEEWIISTRKGDKLVKNRGTLGLITVLDVLHNFAKATQVFCFFVAGNMPKIRIWEIEG